MNISEQTGIVFDPWLISRLHFQKIKTFTKVQQLAIDAGVCQRKSLVICAPTSSGKTLIGELAMLSAIRAGAKTLYLVSHKALADQKFEDFELRYGLSGEDPIARIGISTGDRDDGDPDPDVLVTTYEKAIALVMMGVLSISETTIIADELQILGEDKRGPEIEVLCAALRQRNPKQFVALTATVENGKDLAGWLNCELVQTTHRDVDLIQEIWARDQIYKVKFGQDQGASTQFTRLPTTTLDAVDQLRKEGRGPILVFTETRADAMKLATEYSARCSKTAAGYKFAEQLELFSEATEFSIRLKSSSETNVAFHTADLTSSERTVVEQGLTEGHFEVCFATPTLAAGVNFPFKTVLFDRIRRRYIPPADIPLGAYRNMSGRAGRLGMHNEGYAIMIPRDNLEMKHANYLVGTQNELLYSKLASLSVRKIVLQLIACENATDSVSTREFLENTLFWYQVQDKNPTKLDELILKIEDAIQWLVEAEMIVNDAGRLRATKFGKVVAQTGLLPTTALFFGVMLRQNSASLEVNFENFEVALLLAVCHSDEFNQEIGQRFLPGVTYGAPSEQAYSLLNEASAYSLIQSQNIDKTVAQCVYALYLFISGESERKIGAWSGVPSGQLHRFAGDIQWVLNGIRQIATVPNILVSQKVMNQIGIFARRVQLGVPMELIDLVTIAQRAKVPGFGRQRALALRKVGFDSPEKILEAPFDALEGVLVNRERTKLLLKAIENSESDPYKRMERQHMRFAKTLGLEELVEELYSLLGGEYENPVERILSLETTWVIQKLDDGMRQGVPDFMITMDEVSLVLECKTTTKKPPQINKEEAFAVLHKAADIANVHKVTLGKPGFDTFSASKACASIEISLLQHSYFVEAMLLLRSGSKSAKEVFEWMITPGVSEIDRLGRLPII